MKKQDKEAILNSFSKEELPSLMSIASEDVLPFHIDSIERKVRSDDMYDIWRAHNKRHDKAYIDPLDNIDISELKMTKINLHHVPLTLYEVVYKVAAKLIRDNGETDEFEIAKVVLEEHLLGNIGYCPLLISNHQLVHDGILKIKPEYIKGNWEKFEEKYNV